MEEERKSEGCVSVAAGPLAPKPATGGAAPGPAAVPEAKMNVMVGHEAPDFEASAFHGGGFKNVKLSDYRGRWVFLCFYPGDFTFV